MKLWLTYFLFKIKDWFFKNDISTFTSVAIFYLGGVLIYWIGRYVGYYYQSFFELDFTAFLSIWSSSVGAALAFFVMLNINNEKTSTGRDFIDLLSTEIYRLKKDEEITIISPNINIGSYKYRGESIFEKAVKYSVAKGAKIHFITLAIDPEYLRRADLLESSNRVNFIKEGKKHNCYQLEFIYKRYIKIAEEKEDELDDKSFLHKLFRRKDELTASQLARFTIQELKYFILQDNITFTHCDDRFKDDNLVGFYTDKKFYIADYSDLQSEKGKVKVTGELIKTPAVVKVSSEYIRQQYLRYEVSFTSSKNRTETKTNVGERPSD